MSLSPELFQEVVDGLTQVPQPSGIGESAAPSAGTATPPGGEQRRRPRVGVQARVTLVPFDDEMGATPFTVPVRNLSADGIGFLHDRKVGLDQKFVVLLPAAARPAAPEAPDTSKPAESPQPCGHAPAPLAVLCSVVYWQPLAENLFAIGARFDRVLCQGSPATAPGDPAGPARPAPGRQQPAATNRLPSPGRRVAS